jgi:hypothetical protein
MALQSFQLIISNQNDFYFRMAAIDEMLRVRQGQT